MNKIKEQESLKQCKGSVYCYSKKWKEARKGGRQE